MSKIIQTVVLTCSLLLLAILHALAAPVPSPVPVPSGEIGPSPYAVPRRPATKSGAARPKAPPRPGSRASVFSTPPQIVNLRAQRVTQIGNRTIAEGEAIAISEGMLLNADRIEVDFDQNSLTAEGHVRMFQGGDEVNASRVNYDLVTKVADLRDAYGIARNLALQNQPLQSEVYFWSPRMRWDGRTMVLTKGVLTTCDLAPPRWHYHTTGDVITVYPEDKVVVRKARLFVGKRQVLGRPTVVFSLRERQRSLIPSIGNNGTDGWFIKETLGLSIDRNTHGLLHIDYYQKTGLGLGVEGHYKVGARGSGNLYLYDVLGAKDGYRRYDVRNHTDYYFAQGLQGILDVFANEFQSPRDKVNSPASSYVGLALLKYGPRHQAYLNSAVFNNVQGYHSLTENLVLKNTFTDRLTNHLEFLYSRSSYNNFNSHYLRTYDRLAWRGDLFDSDLTYESTSGSSLFVVNRTPEIALRSREFRVGPVPLRITAGASQIEELPFGNRAWRGDFGISVPDLFVPVGDSGSLNMGLGVRQMFYDSGDAQYHGLVRANYMQDVGDYVRTRLDYRLSRLDGYTPLQTDFYPNYNSLSAGLEFHDRDWLRLGFYGGRDFDYARYYNLETRLFLSPARGWRFDVGSNYDLNFGRLGQVDTNVRIPLSPSLSVQHYMLYDLNNRRLTYQDFMIQDEGHDWVTSVVYRSVQNQIMLQIGLKAFPFEIPTVGPNQHNPVLPLPTQVQRSIFR